MIKVGAEQSRNLVRVSYTGRIEAEEAKRSVGQIMTLVGGLQPGFRLLTDLSSLEVMEIGCVPYIKEVMDYCDERRIAQVVRVIPDPRKDIGLNILSLFHYRRGVRIVTCETIAEAEAALTK